MILYIITFLAIPILIKASVYPKYGKIKNFVYDIGVQDVHPNINMENYPMYNATANNDYDSYPSVEEYISFR